jgi:hypothetical protein
MGVAFSLLHSDYENNTYTLNYEPEHLSPATTSQELELEGDDDCALDHKV